MLLDVAGMWIPSPKSYDQNGHVDTVMLRQIVDGWQKLELDQ